MQNTDTDTNINTDIDKQTYTHARSQTQTLLLPIVHKLSTTLALFHAHVYFFVRAHTLTHSRPHTSRRTCTHTNQTRTHTAMPYSRHAGPRDCWRVTV